LCGDGRVECGGAVGDGGIGHVGQRLPGRRVIHSEGALVLGVAP
jgi:hypothetical protein